MVEVPTITSEATLTDIGLSTNRAYSKGPHFNGAALTATAGSQRIPLCRQLRPCADERRQHDAGILRDGLLAQPFDHVVDYGDIVPSE
jgi:hypothetical protein